MSKANILFKNFLSHDLILSKYRINKEKLPSNIREGLNSDIPIIRSIAEIINSKINNKGTDKETFELVSRYLNSLDL